MQSSARVFAKLSRQGAILCGALLIGAAGWPTASHDARRTGQSAALGPRTSTNTASIALTQEQAINMPVSVADDGSVYSGTWGMVRSYGSNAPVQWNKFDGKLFALDRDLTLRWTAPLDRVPFCYAFPGRPPADGCAGGTLNGYNGTVEGTVAIDTIRNRLYVGRGDGKLYAIDAKTGNVAWSVSSVNPLLPSDPEGGGEIVAGPLIGVDGSVFFASVAVGDYETNAVYAVAPNGAVRWRFPSGTSSLSNVIWAAPALSPDGRTIYVGGAWGPTADHWDTSVKGNIYAIDASTGVLRWTFQPINEGVWWKPTVWTEKLAVGTDGTIYAAGTEYTAGGGSAVLFALRDRGGSAEYAWPQMIDIDYGRAAIAGGLALRESTGVTLRVYATSGNAYSSLQGYRPGGKLVAVDARSGERLWTFDPESQGGTGAMTGIALDSEGTVYTGVSGARDKGVVYAIRPDGSLLWKFNLGGLLEWAHPVLGPFGDLYVAETRRCLLNAFPVETGICGNADISPRIYVVKNDRSRRRAARSSHDDRSRD